MKKQNSSLFRRGIPALLLTAGVFFLTYAIVLRFCTNIPDINENSADYIRHTLWAIGMTPEKIVGSFYNGSERLWHICVKFLFGCTHNMWVSAAIVTAAANAVSALLLFAMAERALSGRVPAWATALFTAVVFIAGALYLPGARFYADSGAFNTWHNPTNIMVRPFALAIFYMTVRLYDRRRYGGPSTLLSPENAAQLFAFRGSFWAEFRRPVYKWYELILYPLCILFSTYAKPSFLQFFAPAIFILLLIDVIRSRGMLLPFCVKLALAYLPAAVILLAQFSSFFSGGVATASAAAAEETASSSILVYFLQASFDGAGDFFLSLGRLLLRILRLSAFPLFILLIAPRRFFQNTACRLGFIGAAVARLEATLLHETGYRATHGNFLWGLYLSVWVLWCSAAERFLPLLRERSRAGKLARWIGSPLLVWHLASGVAYFVKCFQTSEYYL